MLDSPLASWFESDTAVRRFRRAVLGRRPAILPPRNRAWRHIAPDFDEALAMARGGLPFQIALDRRYDRSGAARRLAGAVRAGATIFMPQVHQVLPRVARLMAALRAALLGPYREECSFLFLVEGRGRPGMGLHHDGAVDAMWIQLAGRRTVTFGPRVPPRTPPDLAGPPPPGDPRWTTVDLEPGSLFSLPPWTPHDVVCHARSLALSLTWASPRAPRAGRAGARIESLTRWDVVSGRATALPPLRRGVLWTQLPVATGSRGRAAFALWTADGAIRLPAAAWPLARRLTSMPAIGARDGSAAVLRSLAEVGVLAPRNLPLRIVPDDPRDLDGWRFA